MNRYNNYHRHSHKSNVMTLDSITKNEEYFKRAVELGHDKVFTTEHGFQGDLFEMLTLGEQYGLQVVLGAECYYVKDRKEPDKSNNHIILVALNDDGVRDIQRIVSEANVSGFYYKPRIDHELLFSVNPNNIIVTTACIAGIWKYEDLVAELASFFGQNFFLEVQDHNVEAQKEMNRIILDMSHRYNIPIIHANDSHYIKPEDAKYRSLFLKAKGITYEEEDNFILDYPDYDEIVKRYEEQGVLTKAQIDEALENTLVFDACQPITMINEDVKLPSIVDNPNEELKKIINESWKKKKEFIPKEKREEYLKSIKYEYDIIEKTGMADYFILDHDIVQLAETKYGGTLTKTGRGCFTGDANVLTKDGYKEIKNIEIGEMVLTNDGTYNKVLQKMEYDIIEPMLKIVTKQNNKYYISTCTLDHKILIRRNNKNTFIEARNIKDGDLCCLPAKVSQNRNNNALAGDLEYNPIKILKITEPLDIKVYDIAVENHHNYVLNGMIVHNSAPSFYVTNLLGLTDIDRMKSPVTLFPTRFMSVERILGAKSLPDIDLNTADAEPFIKASKDILGERNCAWMIAWKPLQKASAFRLYCKAIGMDISQYNDIAKEIDSYEDDLHWGPIIKDSEPFVGVIESMAPSPCSMCLYYKPIDEEIGLIKVKDKIVCLLDGYNCDKYKYLKNDYLTTMVWGIIKDVCQMANISIPTIEELNQLLDDKTYQIYEKGLTCTINQADSNWATSLVMRYKPKSVADMSAFVAIIRPGCASLLQDFIDRKPYTTGIPQLDEILEDSGHRMIYQESIMKYLIWLGIPETGSYDIIKKIAKKKFKENELKELKEKLKIGWAKQVGKEEGFEETWQVVQDASKYSFNCSHSLSYAYDSLYGAYLKSHYPLEYYTVTLNYYNGDEDRTKKLTEELKYFGIKLEKPRFRYSKEGYFFDKETNTIYKGTSSIKYLNKQVSDYLYSLRDMKFDSFSSFLIELDKNRTVDSRQMTILITLQFFAEFGKNKKLLDVFNLFKEICQKERKNISKDTLPALGITDDMVKSHCEKETAKQYMKIDAEAILKEYESKCDNVDLPIKEQMKYENEVLGYLSGTYPYIPKRYCYVTEIDTKYSPKVNLYCLNNGKMVSCKISKFVFEKDKIKKGDILECIKFDKKNKVKRENDKFVKTDEKEWWLSIYLVTNNMEAEELIKG